MRDNITLEEYLTKNFKYSEEYLRIIKEFSYPEEYAKIMKLGLTNIEPWIMISNERQVAFIFEGMRKRYPDRYLIPFAQRIDNDDTACFEVGKEGTVQVIHNFASAGWEQREVYNNFSDWFKMAVDEMLISDY